MLDEMIQENTAIGQYGESAQSITNDSGLAGSPFFGLGTNRVKQSDLIEAFTYRACRRDREGLLLLVGKHQL